MVTFITSNISHFYLHLGIQGFKTKQLKFVYLMVRHNFVHRYALLAEVLYPRE